MALEFAMNLEDSFGIHVALTSAIGDLTVSGLANEIILQLDLEPASENVVARNMAEKHFGKAEPHELALLEEVIAEKNFEKSEPRQLSLLDETVGDVATRRKGTVA
jgi:hypothetical protein